MGTIFADDNKDRRNFCQYVRAVLNRKLNKWAQMKHENPSLDFSYEIEPDWLEEAILAYEQHVSVDSTSKIGEEKVALYFSADVLLFRVGDTECVSLSGEKGGFKTKDKVLIIEKLMGYTKSEIADMVIKLAENFLWD